MTTESERCIRCGDALEAAGPGFAVRLTRTRPADEEDEREAAVTETEGPLCRSCYDHVLATVEGWEE